MMIQRIQTLYLLIIAALMAVTLFSGLAWFAGDAGEFGLYAFGLKTAEGELVQSTVYMGVLLALACALPLVTIFLFRRRLLQIRLCVVEMVLLLGSLVMEGVYYFLSWRVFSDLTFHTQGFKPAMCCLWSACCLPIWRPVRFSATNCWCAQPTEYADRADTADPEYARAHVPGLLSPSANCCSDGKGLQFGPI